MIKKSIKKSIKKIISLIVVCSLLSIYLLPSPILAKQNNNYIKTVIENFENSFNKSDYFDELCSDKYYYEKFSDNMEEVNLPSKAVVFLANSLMDTNLNKDAYINYLTQLLAMMQEDLAKIAYDKSRSLDIIDAADDITASSISAFFEIDGSVDFINNILGVMKDTVDIHKTLEMDTEQAMMIQFAVTNYENQYLILNSIKENTDNKHLKKACDEILEVSAQQCIYISSSCILNNLKLAKDTAKSAWDEIYSIYGNEINQNFVDWLKNTLSTKASTSVLKTIKVASKFLKFCNHASIGFDIGSGIMKIFVGNKYEMVQEELALAQISDALTNSVIKTKNDAMIGSEQTRYSKILEYIPLMNALIYTHTRGEYCAIQSGNKKEREGTGKAYYENILCPQMVQYQKVISGILIDNDILEKTIDALDEVKSIHLSQNTISDYSVSGRKLNATINLESDINITGGISYTNMITKSGGRSINSEIYIQTNNHTADIYLSSGSKWLKQCGVPTINLYKLGSGFDGLSGIKFYLNSMEDINFDNNSDEYNYIISGITSSESTEEALKKAGLSNLLEQFNNNDEISTSEIQSILSNLAPMKITLFINKETYLPDQMIIDIKDTTDSIYNNIKNLASKYDENFSYNIKTNKIVTNFSSYNNLSEIFIPDDAINGISYTIVN